MTEAAHITTQTQPSPSSGSENSSPSPFLPGTDIMFAWDSTSLGMFKTCPQLYKYVIIDGWTSHDESPHLTFGIEYHRALQEYDVARFDGKGHDDAVRVSLRALLTRTSNWKSDHKLKNRDYLVRTVLWYLEQFKNDPAKTFKLDNGKPAVEVSFKFELGWGPTKRYDEIQQDGSKETVEYQPQPYLLSGHLDRIVEYDSSLFVMDRKTTTSTPGDYYFNQFSPNNQMSLYSYAAQIVVHSPVKGVIIDCAQVAVGFSRFVRGMTYRTTEQLEEWMEDLKSWLALAEQYAVADKWPKNDTSCDKFGGCRFRDICSKSPRVREKFLNTNFTKAKPEDRWNPLKAR